MKANQVVSTESDDIHHRLIERYYDNNTYIQKSLETLSPAQFLRLFITTNGMKPHGQWLTHTYCKIFDDSTQLYHFFLIPMVKPNQKKSADIRIENNVIHIDEFKTNIVPQNIPHTTPFWYFHYNPNTEATPYQSMTLNLSPDCLEKCVLCAGAKTGRVNNGMDGILDSDIVSERIFNQHPDAAKQLDSVAIVTGCFENFNQLESHLRDVKKSISNHAKPTNFRVLEHNIETESQFNSIVSELGYEIFVTLECYDQKMRDIALNGKVGRKGRNSAAFIDIVNNYANYLEKHQEVNQSLVRVTYLAGLDSLETTETFFQQLSNINQGLKKAKIIPWMSIFTPYNKAMQSLQHKDFSLEFLIKTINLANTYFGRETMINESGTTSHGYARGLY